MLHTRLRISGLLLRLTCCNKFRSLHSAIRRLQMTGLTIHFELCKVNMSGHCAVVYALRLVFKQTSSWLYFLQLLHPEKVNGDFSGVKLEFHGGAAEPAHTKVEAASAEFNNVSHSFLMLGEKRKSAAPWIVSMSLSAQHQKSAGWAVGQKGERHESALTQVAHCIVPGSGRH